MNTQQEQQQSSLKFDSTNELNHNHIKIRSDVSSMKRQERALLRYELSLQDLIEKHNIEEEIDLKEINDIKHRHIEEKRLLEERHLQELTEKYNYTRRMKDLHTNDIDLLKQDYERVVNQQFVEYKPISIQFPIYNNNNHLSNTNLSLMIPPQTPTSPEGSVITTISSMSTITSVSNKAHLYYLANKDKKILCECGQMIKKVSRASHMKTNKHIIQMDIIKQKQATEMILHEEYFTTVLDNICSESG